MQILTNKKDFYSQPLSHQVLKSLLKGYKRPNDKIRSMLEKGELIALKRGLYVWNKPGELLPEPFVMANALYGPSYVSADSALAYHGLIPERVFTVVSMTLKRPRSFDNHFGQFLYKKLPTPYYAFGIDRVNLRENQFTLMASPEKAVFDKVVTTPGILLRSVKSANAYLEEDLRIDSQNLMGFDVDKMKSWLPDAPKKAALGYVLKALEAL